MNKVMLLGRLAKDPDFATTQSGKSVCNFTVAVDKVNDGAEFIHCRAWEKSAELVKNYFYKGKPILVEGRIENREYTKQDGTKATFTEVVCERIGFVPNETPKAEPVKQEEKSLYDVYSNDLPF